MSRARVWIVFAAVFAGCPGPSVVDTPDAPGMLDAPGGDGGETCTVDTACDDGVFCNGEERCAPGATDADDRGCVAATAAACAAGEVCDEAAETCSDACVDGDGDDHGDVACGGDDCDDADDQRFPGNVEVCDSAAHDEDCNAETFGFLDADSDGVGSSVCCNVLPGGDLGCGGDCNDGDSMVNPRAGDGPPLFCDGVDNDCSGTSDEGCPCVEGETQECGTAAQLGRVGICRPGTQVCSGGAFTETCIGSVPPGEEICDGLDNDCDATPDEGVLRTYYPDVDGDGFGLGSGATATACSAPAGYSSNGTDCDDTVASVSPAATEVCNGVDDNCIGGTDEGFTATFYRDADGDGFGSLAMPMTACLPPSGYVRSSNDCDDTSAARNPSTVELCNGMDDNCNSMTDEGVLRTYYLDSDRDGFGRNDSMMQACTAPAMHVDRAGDCVDTDASINPSASELCNGRDDNCGGGTDTGCTCTDGTSRNCGPASETGECSFGRETCVAGTWASCVGAVSSTAEVCNGLDDDCNGTVDNGVSVTGCYRDGDGDGFGTGGATTQCRDASRATFGFCPVGWVNVATDCNDGVSAIRPGATETCDGVDQDCDGMADEGSTIACYVDADGDAFGTGAVVQRCADVARPAFGTCPSGFTNVAMDCNDSNAGVRPTATETCNGIDDNCAGGVDEGLTVAGCYTDGDSDGFGIGATSTRCRDATRGAYGFCPIGATTTAGDCNDSIASIRPGATEICNDLDDDCDLAVDDGFECRIGTSGACTTGCGTAGSRTCSSSCTFTSCATSDEGPGVAGTCNACDDDGDGRIDDNFDCSPGTVLACVTACGTPGTRVCTGTCGATAPCVAAVETCNFCDDDGDGTYLDDEFAAYETDTFALRGCGTLALSSATCTFGTAHNITLLSNTANDSGAAFATQAPSIGFGVYTFDAGFLNFGGASSVPGFGGFAAVVYTSPGSDYGSNAYFGVNGARRGFAATWAFNGNAPDTITVYFLNGSGTPQYLGAVTVDDARSYDDGDTNIWGGHLFIHYEPPNVAASRPYGRVWATGSRNAYSGEVSTDSYVVTSGAPPPGTLARPGITAFSPVAYLGITFGGGFIATEGGACRAEGSVRLGAGGRIEVWAGGRWGTICDDGVDGNPANAANVVAVICRQLGLSPGSFVPAGSTPDGSGVIHLDQLVCGGGEVNVRDCVALGWDVHDCSASEDFGATCF